jgi:hypothetical protein
MRGVGSCSGRPNHPGVTVLGLAAERCADCDGDADQRNDRAEDGPSGGVAHRAALYRTEPLQCEKQTEQRHEYADNDESNAHAITVSRPRVPQRELARDGDSKNALFRCVSQIWMKRSSYAWVQGSEVFDRRASGRFIRSHMIGPSRSSSTFPTIFSVSSAVQPTRLVGSTESFSTSARRRLPDRRCRPP